MTIGPNRSAALSNRKVWRPLNTIGIYFIALVVGMTLGYTLAVL